MLLQKLQLCACAVLKAREYAQVTGKVWYYNE